MTMPYLCEFGNSGASVSHGHISSLFDFDLIRGRLHYLIRAYILDSFTFSVTVPLKSTLGNTMRINNAQKTT